MGFLNYYFRNSQNIPAFVPPGNLENKRETRLKEFYVRSQRKDTGAESRLEAVTKEHRNSIDRGFTKQRAAALDIMNISQQLDFRNIEKHKGRNFFLDGSTGSQNATTNALNKSGQRSYTELPGLLRAKDKPLMNTPLIEKGNGLADDGRRAYEKNMSKSNYFGAGDGSINFNAIQMNPITGAVSPVQNSKKGGIL